MFPLFHKNKEKRKNHLLPSLLRKACPSASYEGCIPSENLVCGRVIPRQFTRNDKLGFERLEHRVLLCLFQTSEYTFLSDSVVEITAGSQVMLSSAYPGICCPDHTDCVFKHLGSECLHCGCFSHSLAEWTWCKLLPTLGSFKGISS